MFENPLIESLHLAATLFETGMARLRGIAATEARRVERWGRLKLVSRSLTTAVLLAAAGLFAPSASAQSTWTVNSLADNGTATSPLYGGIASNCNAGNANTCTLRDAITAANIDSGDSIVFQSGLTGTIHVQNSGMNITAPMTITGPGGGAVVLTASMTNATYGILKIYNLGSGTNAVAVSGLTFANSSFNGTYGGAAALYAQGGVAVTLNNDVFTGNSAEDGGAIDHNGNAAMTVNDCTFTGNTAPFGGAIYNYGPLNVNNSVFTGNTAPGAMGGAIYNGGGTVTVSGSTFARNGNATTNGGAIFQMGANGSGANTLNIINSTFTGNSNSAIVSSAVNGYTGGTVVNIYNSTFTGNYNYAIQSSGGPMTVENSILTGNSGGDCIDYSGSGQCPTNGTNGNVVSVSAINLAPLGNYGGPTQTMMPLTGSPAICAGVASDVYTGVTTDQRGWPISPSTCPSGHVDAGAVQTNYMVVNSLSDTSNTSDATSCSDGTESATNTCSLRDAITQANTATMADVGFLPSLFVSGTPAVPTPGTITLSSTLPAPTGQLNLVGPGANLLSINGGNSVQIFSITGGTVSISALAIKNGQTSGSGGGIGMTGGTLTLANCVMSGNSSLNGGGIFNEGGTLLITGCTLSNNSSGGYGGAILNTSETSTSTLTVINSTISGNTAVSDAGGISNGAYGTGTSNVLIQDTTISGNSVGYGCSGCGTGGGISYTNLASGSLTITNSIVAGNTYYSVYTPNSGDCEGCGTQSSYNLIGGSAPALGALASSPISAGVQTMIPLPGASSILCAGSSALLPAGVTADERGFPMDPSCSSGAIDLGAAQTNFTQVITTGYNGVVNQVIAPSPWAQLQEKNATTGAVDGVGGIPITIVLNGTGILSGNATVTTAPVLNNGVMDNLAVYPGMSISAAGNDDFVPTINGLTPSEFVFGATINVFDIGSTTAAELAFATPPPASVVAGGNAGSFTVQEETADGLLITSAADTITLTVTGPNSYSQSYTATAVNGVATFNLSGAALTVGGSYTYTASFSGATSATASETVTAQTTAAGLAVSGYPTTAYVGFPATGTVEAVDTYNNVVTSFNGAVSITTTDSAATVSTPITLNSGVGSFTVTFATAGTQTITASATGMVSGTETGITAGTVPSFVVTAATDTTAGVAANCPSNSTGANCSLRDALAAASQAGGGAITFSPTAFATAQTITLGSTAASTLMIPANTSITGPTTGSGATLANLVTVDGAGTYTVFTAGYSSPGSTASIANLNIQNGNGGADGYGGPGNSGGAGGINNYGTLTVTHCVFTTNTGSDAGALYNWDGQLTVSASTFTGNSSLGGGANTGWYGDAGAIFNDDESPVGPSVPGAVGANGVHPLATASPMQRRYHTRGHKDASQGAARPAAKATATAMASGSLATSGTLTVTGSTFTGNSGTYTGGIFNYATATVTNSTFGGTAAGAGNISIGDGNGDADAGALNNGTDMNSSSATVTNSTFTNNSGTWAGAIINADDWSLGTNVQVSNSTFSGNKSSGDGYGDLDAGAINATWGEYGYSVNNSTEIAYSTFYQNVSSSQSGGGAIANSYYAATTVVSSTFSGNSGYYGAAYGDGSGPALIGNSIISGNATTDPSASTDGTTPDMNGFTDQGGNIVGASATNLAPLGNYGGPNPTQTMIPLPASSAICAGSYSFLQAINQSGGLGMNLTADQRGLPDTNGSYPGYTASAPCVDAGAVQTNYAIAYTTAMPSSATVDAAIAPAPVVQLTESGLPAIFAASSIAFSDSATPTALGGTTTEPFLNGSATFSNLDFTTAVAGDTLTAALLLNSSLTPALNLTLTSSVSATAPAITLLPATLPNGTAGVAYTQTTITASGGTAPYSYAVTTGSLPAGLTLSTSGLLSGTPTAAGAFNFTVTATDGNLFTGSQVYSVTISAPAITLLPATLPNGTAGVAYTQTTITASGGIAPYSYAVTTGSLPAGLTLSTSGLLSGTPTAAGTFNITVTATDSNLFTGSQAYSVTISAAAPPADFIINATTAAATVPPGSSAVFAFTVGPAGGATTFPAEVMLSATGLPPGATYTFSPTTIAAGASTTTVTLTIHTPLSGATVGQIKTGPGASGTLASRLAPFSLALLLLPFAARLRKTGKRFSRLLTLLLLFIAGTLAIAGVSGCGSNTGFFGQAQKSYTVTVTGTMGTLLHSTNVTLTVE